MKALNISGLKLFLICFLAISIGCSNKSSSSDTKTSLPHFNQESALEKFALTAKKYGIKYENSQVAFSINEKEQTLITAPSEDGSSFFLYVGEASRIEHCRCSRMAPGLYEATFDKQAIATMYYYSPIGKVAFYFPELSEVDPIDPRVAQLGDPHDICRKAEDDSSYRMCFQMVLCHQIDAFCSGGMLQFHPDFDPNRIEIIKQ